MKEFIFPVSEEDYGEDYKWIEEHNNGELVRCKDCKWRGNKKKCIVAFVADKQDFPLFFYDNRGNWFCSDGERRIDDA